MPYFFINKDLVFISDKPNLIGSYIGFQPGSNCEMLIDDITIYYLKDDPTLSWIDRWDLVKNMNRKNYYQNFIQLS